MIENIRTWLNNWNTYSSLSDRPVRRKAQISNGTPNNEYVSTDLKAEDRKNPVTSGLEISPPKW